jgi:acetylornithine deacetylase
MNEMIHILTRDALSLLKELVAIPSFSKEEDQAASLLESFFMKRKVRVQRKGNNLIALNRDFDDRKPTILLNSHHDTVRPDPGYSRDPFLPHEEGGRIYGLGTNDAGASLVSLIAVFLYFQEQRERRYNVILAATAEEEISGLGGVESILDSLPSIEFAIVGEPTQMQMAIAERGLMVLDCISPGKGGHAARNEGENAIYNAIRDIDWIRNYEFSRVSELLGPCRLTVTVIETSNKAHNVVPASCHFVVDARVNELYTFDEVLELVRGGVRSEVKARSTRLRSSLIPVEHPVVQAGLRLGRTYYGSPTTSDKALMPFPALKMGPGDSARSHTADEYIYVKEIEEGIGLYIRLLKEII